VSTTLAMPVLQTKDYWASAYPIIPHPGELIFGIVVFVILYVIVARAVVPRLEKVIAERTEAIEGGLEKAEKAQLEANAALEDYHHQLEEARAEAGRIREEARNQGAQILAEMREQAQAESTRIIASANAQVTAERQQAFITLRQDVGKLATDLASRIVGESLEDEARQRRVVDRFLDELESSESAPSGQPSGQAS
jgi:F-type H+-transporting ATPase subunit b